MGTIIGICVVIALIVVVVIIIKWNKKPLTPPVVPPVVPPATQGFYFRVAIYNEDCDQRGFGLINNSVDLSDNMGKFYYNPVLRRIEQIIGVFDPDSTSGSLDITTYTNAGVNSCQEIVI